MENQVENLSEKGFVPTILLCFFFGVFGVHRFYVGKIGTGILMLLTFGGFGFWSLYDFIMIVIGKFTDSNGAVIKNS
ncbi:TM2 domain-containing protein [Psychrobacter sp. HD31]|uniref:TM2 domain-containing protein n=1 Tax=Psychrobacter sp. HD31 TaxID=3112003 RepID=UPI003DA63C63